MIQEFNPSIYPTRLWIGSEVGYEEVEEKFWALTTDIERTPLTREIYEKNSLIVATCFPVCDKESGWCGIFLQVWRPKAFDVGFIAHESSHVADFVFENFDIQCNGFEGGEAKAYFIQWVANCIVEHLNVKLIKNKKK
jgi:hypothetical protein